MSEETSKWPTACMRACMTTRACDTSSISKSIACLCARQYDRDRIRTCIRENCSVPESASFYDWCAWEIRYLPPELLESSATISITTTRDVSSIVPGTTIMPNHDTATPPDSLVTLPTTTYATESISRFSSVVGTSNLSPSSLTSTSPISGPVNVSSQGRALTTGAKAGIGVVAALVVVALLGIAFVFLIRRQSKNKYCVKGPLDVLPREQDDHYPGTWPKPELPGHGNEAEAYKLGVTAVILEQHEPRQNGEWHEVDGNGRQELDSAPRRSDPVQKTETGSFQSSTFTERSPCLNSSLAGPIPAAADLYPAPQGPKDDRKETDLDYQARREEKRHIAIMEWEMLTQEKEQLAKKEEALWRRQATRTGTDGWQ